MVADCGDSRIGNAKKNTLVQYDERTDLEERDEKERCVYYFEIPCLCKRDVHLPDDMLLKLEAAKRAIAMGLVQRCLTER